MGNSKGSADSVVGDGPIWTEFFLCPNDDPVLVSTVNMLSIAGALTVSVNFTQVLQWSFPVGQNDPYAVVTVHVHGVSGRVMQRVVQYPRSNRHREDMKKFLEDLRLLRAKPEQKEGKKDGRGSKQSDAAKEVPGGKAGVPSGDNEGGDGPGEAEVPANDQ